MRAALAHAAPKRSADQARAGRCVTDQFVWSMGQAGPYNATRTENALAALLVEDVFTSSVSKTLQLSFSKPLRATACETRLRAFHKLSRSATYCSRTVAFLFPAIACGLRPLAATPLLAKKRANHERIHVAFADQRSWLIAFRRAQLHVRDESA